MTDPMTIATEALRSGGNSLAPMGDAGAVLLALREAGWRIVRTVPIDSPQGSDAYEVAEIAKEWTGDD